MPASPDDRLQACAALGGAAPQSIGEALDRINALPEPGSLECFLASLPRPLRLAATNSQFSLQPADGPESPRIFLLTEGLVLSVVPSGPGSHLLELSEWVSETHTLKGEVAFPVQPPLNASAAFERLPTDQQLTTCGHCHLDEQPHGDIEGGFASLAFGLQPGTEVDVDQVRALRDACDTADASRAQPCDMLRALFDYGPVEQGAFPQGIALFLQDGSL